MNYLRYRGTLFQQIGIAFVLITVVPLLVLGWLQYSVSSGVVMKNNEIMLNNMMGQSKQHLQALLGEVDRTHVNVIDSEEMIALLSKEPSNEGEETLFVTTLLMQTNAIKSMADIEELKWYPYNPDAYPLYNRWLISQDYMQKEWYQDAQLRAGQPIWRLEQIPVQYGGGEKRIMTQYRLLKDKYTLKPLGFIGVSLSEQKLREHMLLPNSLENQRMLLIDGSGAILADTETEEQQPLAEPFHLEASRPDGSEWVTSEGKRYFVSHTVLNNANWRILSFIPEKTLIGPMLVIRNAVIGLLFGYFLLGGCLAFYLFTKITRPVTDLASWMKQVDAGNMLHMSHSYTGQGEIPFLFRCFQNMVYRLEEQIAHIYDSERKKKELEFQALNYQIRPHFLYNTLDVIKWKAAGGKQEEVVEMIESLSGMLRTTLHGSSVVTVATELEQVKYYVELEQFRQQDSFIVLYDIDERALQHPIPRLLIQPLVENAIRHGVLNRNASGSILVNVHQREELLAIEVLDNGPGFPDHFAIGESHLESNAGGGIGLQNVAHRLALYYGDRHSFEWGKTPGNETFVRILLRGSA
ncbi:MAG: histidine kinase [Paenibacillaceae bacterium]|nr:histidine kinase [Paenibacillaceae bacterium]